MAKTLVAVEVEATSPQLRSWVAVYPKMIEKGIDHFEVRRFELRKELVDEYFSQTDVLNLRSREVKSLSEVEQVLQEWGIAAERLQPPWRCDYPL